MSITEDRQIQDWIQFVFYNNKKQKLSNGVERNEQTLGKHAIATEPEFQLNLIATVKESQAHKCKPSKKSKINWRNCILKPRFIQVVHFFQIIRSFTDSSNISAGREPAIVKQQQQQ